MASTSKNGEKEKAKNPSANQDDSKAREVTPVCIDFANIDQRILALPFPSRNYSGMLAGKTHILFLLEGPPVDDGSSDQLHEHPVPEIKRPKYPVYNWPAIRSAASTAPKPGGQN